MSDTKPAEKPLGFLSCWSLTVGCVIGSGVLMLPTVLAPYGLLSFVGFLIAGAGAIAVALCYAHLAGRTTQNGGPYAYAREAFGDLAGFISGWSTWVSFWIAIPVVAIAFVGYLTIFFPTLSHNPLGQALAALALIWALTIINVRGLKEASFAQILMTILKIVPLIAITALGAVVGAPENLPAFNPTNTPILPALAAVALICLWPFTGFEASTMSAGNVTNAKRTIPRALITGMIAVAIIYLGAIAAVMFLVPSATLATSTAPFADAARQFGAWGPPLVAIGALIATAGTLNAVIFTCGQGPMAAALDGLAPTALGATNRGGAPHVALILSSVLGSALLALNYAHDLVGAYTLLLTMSTATTLVPYLLTAAAVIRRSWRDARGWALIAVIAIAFSLFALIGSGAEVLIWGAVLTLGGAPFFYLFRWMRQRTPAAASPTS